MKLVYVENDEILEVSTGFEGVVYGFLTEGKLMFLFKDLDIEIISLNTSGISVSENSSA